MPSRGLARSYLFAPGSNAQVVTKALDVGADAVVFDLEDAVGQAAKDEARSNVATAVAGRSTAPGGELHVRVNRDGAGFDASDLRATVRPGLDALRLPKCAGPGEVQAVGAMLDQLEAERGLAVGSVGLYPTVESAAGALSAGDIAVATSRVVALVFGEVDFLADISAGGADARAATMHARSGLVLASRAAGVRPPVDGAFTVLDDLDGLRDAAIWARNLGFFGKSVIHPRQLDTVHDVFTPNDDEVAHARRIVESLEEGQGTGVVDGELVDAAVLVRARAVLELAEALAR